MIKMYCINVKLSLLFKNVDFFFKLEINTFFQQGRHIILIKSDSKNLYNVKPKKPTTFQINAVLKRKKNILVSTKY